MTTWQLIGLVLSPFALMLTMAISKQHREETGVNVPSRGAQKALRRRVRKRGITEQQAYAEWVERKQKQKR